MQMRRLSFKFPSVTGLVSLGLVLNLFLMRPAALGESYTSMGIALSVAVLGTSIALALRAPVWVAAIIVGAFAIFHGYAHGRELPSAADPAGYSSGFVLATGLDRKSTRLNSSHCVTSRMPSSA